MEQKAPKIFDRVPSSSATAGAQTLRSKDGRLSKVMRSITDPAVWFGIATIALGLGVLEILVQTGMVSKLIIAAPSRAIGGLFDRDNLLELLSAMRLTSGLIAAALILEVLVALPFGYFLFRFPNFGKAYEGWLASLFAAPIFLLYPLFMVIFGRSVVTLIAMGFAAGVIPIIVYVRLAFMTVPQTLIRVGQSYGLSEHRYFV
jgi:NitT/TauT family transport system permease protein